MGTRRRQRGSRKMTSKDGGGAVLHSTLHGCSGLAWLVFGVWDGGELNDDTRFVLQHGSGLCLSFLAAF
jgi:hypothetical protein